MARTGPSASASRAAPWVRILRFLRDPAGIGAVEFALIAPFLLLLYAGGSELTIAITINRKVEHTAATLNDLITQSPSLNAAELEGIYQLSKSLFLPYSAAGLKIRVTSVYVDATGAPTVDWSCPTQGMSTLAKGTNFTLPAEFAALRDRYILVSETAFPYSPMTVATFTGTVELGGTSYLDPRAGIRVASDGCSTITL